MTHDEKALLEGIREQPDDQVRRLVYADWLEELGEADRAEFIRLECEIESLSSGDPRLGPLTVRYRTYLNEQVIDWRRTLPRINGVTWGDFQRGVIQEVQLRTGAGFVKSAKLIFSKFPVWIVRLMRLTDTAMIAALPEMIHVRELRLINAGVTAHSLSTLLASPHLANLTVLSLDANRLESAAVEDLAEAMPRLPNLRRLWLGTNRIGDRGATLFTTRECFRQLERLDLSQNLVGDRETKRALTLHFGKRVTV